MAAATAVRCITSSTLRSLTAAMASPTNGRYDGSFVRPRWGTGARNGLSVSTSIRSSGHRAAAGAHVGRVLERHDAAERDVHARAQAPVGLVRAAGEAVQHGALGDALGLQHVEQVRPGVAARGSPGRGRARGPARSATRRRHAGPRAASARSSSRGRTRPPRPPRRRPAATSSARRAATSSTPSLASWGCSPMDAQARGGDPARAVPGPAPRPAVRSATPVPMHTRRSMPASRARAITGSRCGRLGPVAAAEVLLLHVTVGVEPAPHVSPCAGGTGGRP